MGLLSALFGKRKPKKLTKRQVKKNNKAWWKLNKRINNAATKKRNYTTKAGPAHLKQADILKKEGRYIDSIIQTALGFLILNYSYGRMNRNAFIKRISVAAKRAGLKQKDINNIADILSVHVDARNGDESGLIREIKRYIEATI